MVNYIKARPLKPQLFAKICKEMEANYETFCYTPRQDGFHVGKHCHEYMS